MSTNSPFIQLELARFNGGSTLGKLRLISENEIAQLDCNNCFWLGCVDIENKINLDSFNKSLFNTDLHQLQDFQDISTDGIYVVLISVKDTKNWRFLAIRSFGWNQSVYYSSELDNIEIKAKEMDPHKQKAVEEFRKSLKVNWINVVNEFFFNSKN